MADAAPLIPHYGTAVVGKSRFDRTDLTERLCELAESSNGARMFGLRRIGKSTQAKHAMELLRLKDMETAWVNLEGANSEADLLFEILQELPEDGPLSSIKRSLFGSNLLAKGIREALAACDRSRLGDVEAYFNTVSTIIEDTLEKIPPGPAGEKVVLGMDEFPWLCRNILESDPQHGRERVNRLLAFLRKWRNRGMRMILLGSIGMTSLGRKHSLDLELLHDNPPLTVPPLDRDEALEMVNRLVIGANVEQWTNAHTEALLDESVALYPAMLQRAFQSLHRRKVAVPLETIPVTFEKSIRPDLDSDFYQQFDRRRKQIGEADQDWKDASEIIIQAVLSDPGSVERKLIDSELGDLSALPDIGEVFAALREDGFIDLSIRKDGTQLFHPASTLTLAWFRVRGGAIQ